MATCSCSGEVPTINPDDYDKYLRDVLEEVRKNIPKVFVSLVLMGNISEVRTTSEQLGGCG